MRKKQQNMGYVIGYAFWWALSLLPLRLLYVFSDILYFLLTYVVRYREKIIIKNLTSSFPHKTPKEIQTIQRRFYHWFCDYIVETVKLMSMNKAQLQKHIRFENIEILNQQLKKGNSCALYLGHYCNWEWVTSLPYWIERNALCCQLYHPLENASADKLFRYVREKQGAKCITMQESIRKIFKLQQHQPIVVGYIADQVPLWQNIHHWVNFLQHDTPVFNGSERIIKRMNQTCFYLDIQRPKRGYYVCKLQLIAQNPKESKPGDITNAYFFQLEKTICRQPEFWLWSHNRWKRTREEYNKRFKVNT